MQVASLHQDRLHCFHCHAGMNEFIYPVVFDHALLGYFMFGQVRIIDIPDDENARLELYSKYHLDKNTMEEKYEAFPHATRALMESAGRMLGALASYAHLNGLMKMKNICVSLLYRHGRIFWGYETEGHGCLSYAPPVAYSAMQKNQVMRALESVQNYCHN